MASTFVLKRKTFDDSQQPQQKSSLGKKIAIGAAGTLATAGTLAFGAKKGMFGAKAQMGINRRLGQMGSSISKYGQKHNIKALQNLGDNTMSSAAVDYGKGYTKNVANTFKTSNPVNLTQEAIETKANALGQKAGERQLNKWLG